VRSQHVFQVPGSKRKCALVSNPELEQGVARESGRQDRIDELPVWSRRMCGPLVCHSESLYAHYAMSGPRCLDRSPITHLPHPAPGACACPSGGAHLQPPMQPPTDSLNTQSLMPPLHPPPAPSSPGHVFVAVPRPLHHLLLVVAGVDPDTCCVPAAR
jgi:hypothetical protein